MSDHEFERMRRHANTRRAKKMLRYAPRRAVFHRYPFIGRFAALARRRAYLWSFKPQHVRPAIYAGAVLSLWPVMGIQLILAFIAALTMRSNIMVVGVLQFITNPLTAAPIYYVTYRVGKYVLALTGFTGGAAPQVDQADAVTITISPGDILPQKFAWASAFGSTVMALFVGGTLCGLLLAVILDVIYTSGWKFEHRPRDRARDVPPKKADGEGNSAP